MIATLADYFWQKRIRPLQDDPQLKELAASFECLRNAVIHLCEPAWYAGERKFCLDQVRDHAIWVIEMCDEALTHLPKESK